MTSSPVQVPSPHGSRRAEILTYAGLAGWILLLFGACWNPWWVPTGDSEVFLVVGRNLLQGKGLVFNGADVAFIPPGWPLVLSVLFRVTNSVLWLKLFQILCMGGFLLLSYAILRHFVERKVAALGVAGAATLTPLYPLTFWLHSDALFCLVSGVTGLVALRYGNRSLGTWALVVVVLGCAFGVIVRWAALAQVVVLAGLICGSREKGGRRWPYLETRHWVGVALCVLTTFGTFFCLSLSLGSGGAETDLARREGGSLATILPALPLAASDVDGVPEEGQIPPLLNTRHDPAVGPLETVWKRFISIPQWLSWTLFQPLRISAFGAVSAWIDRAVGLLTLWLLGLAAWQGSRHGQWLFLAVGIYVIGLAMNWPLVNNRYMVPVAPFLIAGVLQGLAQLETWRRAKGLSVLLTRLFLLGIFAFNLPLWAIDVWVSRATTAEDFYARYEAGIYGSLIDVSAYLARQTDIGEGDIAASLRYENLQQRWEYKTSPRVVLLFTGIPVKHVPKLLAGAGVKKAQAWARENGIRYYVQQNPTVPGRVWHFRVTPETHEEITGNKVYQEAPQFELFSMQHDPIPTNPELYSLRYHPAPVIRGSELERLTRRIPLEPRTSPGPR